jgi:hypothetical protein
MQAARLLQGFSSTNTDVADAINLRAAAEQNQLYNQALLDQLNAVRSASSLFPNQQRHDLLSTQGATHSLRSPQDYLGLAASSSHLIGIPSNASASLYAAGLGNPVTSGGNSALTRRYLQLLQNRQDAANSAQLAEAGVPGDVASLLRSRPNDRQE